MILEVRACHVPGTPPSRQIITNRTSSDYAEALFSSPWANRSAASILNFSRKARRSSLNPPPCAYLMQTAHRRDHRSSAPADTTH